LGVNDSGRRLQSEEQKDSHSLDGLPDSSRRSHKMQHLGTIGEDKDDNRYIDLEMMDKD